MHGYQGSGGRRDLLYTDVVTSAGKTLWNSEYGDSDGTGLTMASNLSSTSAGCTRPPGSTGR